MTKSVKYIRMMWTQRISHGPDVEEILYMPIAVAVESKPTVATALKEIGQIIKYAKSGVYDSVFVRLETPPRTGSAELRILMEVARQHGIGIVLGGDTYAPLTGSESILLWAPLKLHGDPAMLYQKRRKMKYIIRNTSTVEAQLRDLLFSRRYFK